MKPVNKLTKTFFNVFWWLIILIFTYTYIFYLPYDTFGNSQFNILFWGVNFLTGFYILMRTGGFVK